MRLLNLIESVPLKYIAKIFRFELAEAYNAFRQGREYKQISPFFDRFDETVAEDRDSPPTKLWINFGLAETVFTLWREDPQIFESFDPYTDVLSKLVQADRKLRDRPSLRKNFAKTIALHLHREGIKIPLAEVEPFAAWIYDVASRCPALRLSYEVYHKLARNLGDIPQKGDIPDFGHIKAAPYVDLITLDRRMYSYMVNASKDMGLGYGKKIFKNVKEALESISEKGDVVKAPAKTGMV